MTSARRVGRIVGLLLLVHLAIGLIVPYVLLLPLTAPPAAFLDAAAGMSASVRLNVFLLFVGGAVSIAISVAAWPLVRERNRALGIWFLALAAVNFTLQVIENSHWLTMLSVSQAYAEASSADATLFAPLGIAVRSAFKWAHYSHILIVVGWLFTLHCLLFRAEMVPRFLAAFGMAAAVLHIIGITLPVFAGYRMPSAELFGMPLGLASLVIATWLLAKGFKQPAVPPESGMPATSA